MAKGENVPVARTGAKKLPAGAKSVPRKQVNVKPKTTTNTPAQKVAKVAQEAAVAEPSVKKSIDQTGQNKNKKAAKVSLTKQQIAIIVGVVALVLIALVGVIVWLALKKPEVTEPVTDETEIVEEETRDEVDFSQEVTGENGRPFEAEYQQGSEEDYVVRFPNLQCEEGCTNVADVKLGTRVLTLGTDYEVKKGSVIIILKEELLMELKAGDYELTFTVTEDEEMVTVGVKFSVKAAPTCAEDEKLEAGKCVKDEEKLTESGSNTNGSNEPNNEGSTSGGSSSNNGGTSSTQPTQPAKKPDYNLNDRYVVDNRSYQFWTLDGNGQCVVAEEKSFFGVAKFTGQGDDLWTATMGKQYMNYANSKGYNTMDCLGMGSAPTTWEAVVNAGLALDEAKCAQYGLSCGRW